MLAANFLYIVKRFNCEVKNLASLQYEPLLFILPFLGR